MLLKPLSQSSILALACSSTARAATPHFAPALASQIRMSSAGAPIHGLPLEGRRSEIVQGALGLFSGSADTSFVKSFWTTSATFEDPITIATGYDQIVSQWIGLAKVFKKSETLDWKVITNEPALTQVELKQKYTFAGTGTEKVMDSIVHIELEGAEGSEKITRLEDRWDGKKIESGAIGKALRNFNGNTVPYFIKDQEKK